MNRLLRAMFDHRNITDEMLAAWETPETDVLLDLDAIATRLFDIRENNRKIVVLPDFDMDGIMSCVVGVAGLSELGFDVEYFVPDPRAGYGFDKETVRRLLSQHPGVSAIITCDTGIGCVEGVTEALRQGIEVLVTDHHMENEQNTVVGLADVVVDPCRIEDTYSHSAICGAFVLWKVLDYFARKYEDAFVQDQIMRLRVFAGIGTISDSMDLKYANRQLVRDSIAVARVVWSCGSRWFVDSMDALSPTYRQAFVGLFYVLEEFAKLGKIKTTKDINEEFYGFYLAPTFNAVKRMDGDMSRAYGTFLRVGDPRPSISYLMDLNEERKALVKDMFEFVLSDTNQLWAPYCYVVDTKPGINGLLAMKLMQLSNLPTLVVNRQPDGSFSGSGRSPEWFPFLSLTQDIFGGHGAGHEGAFGFSAPDAKSLEAFLTQFAKRVFEVHTLLVKKAEEEGIEEDPFDFRIATDGSGDTGIDIDLFFEFLHDLKRYAPFGTGFPPPYISLEFEATEGRWYAMGADHTHLKIKLPHGFDVVLWNEGDRAGEAYSDGHVCVTGRLAINEFMDNVSVQFMGDGITVQTEN